MNPGAPASSLPVPGQRWLAAGTRLVWVVDLKRVVVEIHEPDGAPRRLERSDMLDGEPLFPGFRLPVTDIFGLMP